METEDTARFHSPAQTHVVQHASKPWFDPWHHINRTCNQSQNFGESEKCKVILNYTVRFWPAWNLWVIVSKQKRRILKIHFYFSGESIFKCWMLDRNRNLEIHESK